jgi:hypothetical protein
MKLKHIMTLGDFITETITAGKKSEQWVYKDDNYLYFDNGELTAIQ